MAVTLQIKNVMSGAVYDKEDDGNDKVSGAPLAGRAALENTLKKTAPDGGPAFLLLKNGVRFEDKNGKHQPLVGPVWSSRDDERHAIFKEEAQERRREGEERRRAGGGTTLALDSELKQAQSDKGAKTQADETRLVGSAETKPRKAKGKSGYKSEGSDG